VRSMAADRGIYNNHKHPIPSGLTGAPVDRE
jgi:hypothetical protein